MNAERSHIMIMAGGTGGHIFPGLAVAEELRTRQATVSWLGTPTGLENSLVERAGFELKRISIRGLRGTGLGGWLAAPWRILRAIIQARRILRRQRPDCVLSMGGYVAGPGAIAARLLRIPLVIHEQNAIAGMTNRLLRPLARRVFTGFPETLAGGEYVGNPVRTEIAELPDPKSRLAGREGPLRVLVVGGSQGAAVFADVVPAALARVNASARPLVVHQAGRSLEATRQAYQKAGVDGDVRQFIDDMAAEWGWADLAICRAGALTVAELAAAGVAAILVPFPHAVDQHQHANARLLTDAGAGWMVDQADFTPDWLAQKLDSLDRRALIEYSDRARKLARNDAAVKVAQACLEVAA